LDWEGQNFHMTNVKKASYDAIAQKLPSLVKPGQSKLDLAVALKNWLAQPWRHGGGSSSSGKVRAGSSQAPVVEGAAAIPGDAPAWARKFMEAQMSFNRSMAMMVQKQQLTLKDATETEKQAMQAVPDGLKESYIEAHKEEWTDEAKEALEDQVKETIKEELAAEMQDEVRDECKEIITGECQKEFVDDLKTKLEELADEAMAEDEVDPDDSSAFSFDSDDDDWQEQLSKTVKRIRKSAYKQGARASKAVRRRLKVR
jgi:membrane-associated HD superfamily phosphohydrolase